MNMEMQIIRHLLMAIDSHEIDGDGEKLKRAAREARVALNRDDR